MDHLNPVTRRVIASHTMAALAVALPWPLLLVLVDEQSNDPMLLGLVGAARMLPYVLLSWWTARLADAMRRDLLVRLTLVVRAALMVGAALALVTDHVWWAVAACTLSVAVGTPAYPAQVAAMPGIAGPQRLRATDLLVTIEVAAFVVGAALGGFLLHPATREVLPWLPAAMTVVALVLLGHVSMPAPRRSHGDEARPSPYRALRRAPGAIRAIAVMAAINLVISLVAVALLPLAVDSWASDAAGYGIATGVLGFAALGAPLLRRLGGSSQASIVWGLCLMAAGLLLVIPVPSLAWSLAPLALAGAAAVSVEAGATAVLQENVRDEVRATVLGLNDTVIIAAALVGSLVAPLMVELLGGAVLLSALVAILLLVAWWGRPAAHMVATVGGTRLEAHEPAGTPLIAAVDLTAAVDRVARRAALRAERLRDLERGGWIVPGLVPGVVEPRDSRRVTEPADLRRPG